jgi:uroporphyrinogen decarboxylase
MTSRERVKSAITGHRPDRIPVHEDFWTDTLDVWKTKGLPERIEYFPPEDPGTSLDNWVDEYFDYDLAVMFLDASPRMPQKVLDRDGDWYTYSDRWGYTAKKPYGKSGTIEYVETETKSKEDWNRLAERFVLEPGDTARIDDRNYFEHFTPYPAWSNARKKYDRLREQNRYILFKDYGPWEGVWRHREFTKSLMDLATDPEWLSEMALTHHRLRKDILEKCLAEGMKPDGFFMVDDLGSSNGPLISPTMFRDIFKPLYAEMGSWLAEHNISFWLHTCGNTELFFEDYIECGVQVMNPLQVSAGLDAVELKTKYSDRLAFYGNIDAHLLDSDPVTLEKEIRRRIEIFRDGGWIYHSDHSVPPTMEYDLFLRMMDLLRNT